jgi:hypothetical protein
VALHRLVLLVGRVLGQVQQVAEAGAPAAADADPQAVCSAGSFWSSMIRFTSFAADSLSVMAHCQPPSSFNQVTVVVAAANIRGDGFVLSDPFVFSIRPVNGSSHTSFETGTSIRLPGRTRVRQNKDH